MSYGTILTDAASFNGVRFAARMSLVQLTDDMISSATMLPAVEAYAISRIPGYATISDSDKALLKSAVTALCAVRALKAIPQSETSLDYSVSRDRAQLVTDLEAQGETDLGRISSEMAAAMASPAIRLSGPSRHREGHFGVTRSGDVLR